MEPWQTTTLTLSVLGILLSAVAYMISKIVGSSTLLNFSKKELLEAVANVFAAVLILAVLEYIDMGILRPYSYSVLIPSISQDAFNTISQYMAGGNAIPTLGEMAGVVSSMVFGCVWDFAKPMVFLDALYAYMKSSSVAQMGLYIPFGPDLDLIGALIDNAYGMTLDTLIIGMFFIKILLFGSYFGPILIMLGFPMRAFAPTRGAGGYLIALGLSFYLVLPFTYLFAMSAMWTQHICTLKMDKNLMGIVKSGDISIWDVYSIFKYVLSLGKVFTVGIEEYTYYLVKNFCVIPIVAIAFALTSTNIGSTVFGARLSEIGRGLIKFV